VTKQRRNHLAIADDGSSDDWWRANSAADEWMHEADVDRHLRLSGYDASQHV
jgi:hypothetical protein